MRPLMELVVHWGSLIPIFSTRIYVGPPVRLPDVNTKLI